MNPSSTPRAVPGKPPTAARAAQRREDTAERVLHTAEELFSAGGFFEVSMAQIADASGVAVGTLYNLFGSKEQLYRTLSHARTLVFFERVSAAVGLGTSPVDCLERYIKEMSVMFVEQAPALRTYRNVMSDARLSFSATLAPETRATFEEGTNMLAGFIAEGITDGTFRPIDPYRSAVALQAITLEYMFLYLDDPSDHPLEELLADLRALVFGALTLSNPRGKNAAMAALAALRKPTD